jgi:hypothetical protein
VYTVNAGRNLHRKAGTKKPLRNPGVTIESMAAVAGQGLRTSGMREVSTPSARPWQAV